MTAAVLDQLQEVVEARVIERKKFKVPIVFASTTVLLTLLYGLSARDGDAQFMLGSSSDFVTIRRSSCPA